MRRGTLLRFASAALLCAAVGWLAATGDRFVAAQPAQPVVPKKGVAKKDDAKEKDPRSRRAVASPFNFNVVRDSGPRLKAARDYLGFKEIPWNTVCPLVQNILDGPDSFYDPDEDDPRGALANKSWGGVQHEAEQILAKFPREGLEFYQQLYGQTAAAILADSVKNGYDIEGLKTVTSRYFFTRAGAEGSVLLGSVQLERGDYADAARHFSRLLTRPNGDDYLTPRVLFRAATAFKRSPEREHNALYAPTAEKLQKATAATGLVIGRKTFTADQLRAELERPVGTVELSAAVGQFATHRGNAQRNPTSDAGPPFLFPSFPAVAMLDPSKAPGEEWIGKQLDYLFAREDTTRANNTFPLPGFFPVATADVLLMRQYDGVRAVALRDQEAHGKVVTAGRDLWVSGTTFGLTQMTGDRFDPDPLVTKEMRLKVEQWWTSYRTGPAAAYLAENPLVGSLSHDGQNVYFVDDIALPPPPATQNPNMGLGGFDPNAVGMPVRMKGAIEAGLLVAVNIKTGGRVWTLGREERIGQPGDNPLAPLSEEDADKTTSAHHLCLNAVFLAPPLPLNGRLYVPVEQAGYLRLLCLDPSNLVPVPNTTLVAPALVWQVKLGRAGSTLASSPARRTQGAFLAAGDGILVCPTNSGAVVGIDLMSRRILWGHVYKENATPPIAKGPAGGPPGFVGSRVVMPDPLPRDRWRASAPVVVGGRVLVSGFDAETIDCLDLRTGALLWRAPRESTDLYVGAVLNDVLMVVGKDKVRGYKVTGGNGEVRGEPDWRLSFGTAAPTGHGAAGKAAYFIPVRHEGDAKAGGDAHPTPVLEIWAVAPDGTVTSKTQARAPSDTAVRFGIGNLVFQDGLVIAQSAAEVAVFPQLEQKRAEMDRKLKANPNDPDGLLSRGDLLQDEGKLREAVADYKGAEKNAPADPAVAEPLRRRIRERLYRAYTELLRQNFAASEGFLDEYAALCESYLDPNETVENGEEHEAKVVERRRLYLSLLAKGREGQGRLDEAFDNYMALARLGADLLQPDPDEPSVLRRADVAARGRIQAMIGRAAPDARKGLEGRVTREWEAVKGGNDLARLREFVGVFGPYFPAGSEAELLLADKLTATNDETAAREAQLHLHRVRTTAADPKLRARATAELAGLMVKAGMLDESVRLYLQLGSEFKDVAVTGGKTGADYLTDLLTDRRLLPYLEPSRYPLPTRVRVEDKSSGGAGVGQGMTSTEVLPAGDFLPEFQKVRFALEMNPQTGGWQLRGYDRASDVARFQFSDIAQFNIGVQGTAGRAFHAGGRVLVAQVGPNVYGYDLSKKGNTAAWKLSLTGDLPTNMGFSANPRGPDEIELMYQDGTKVTIRTTGIAVRPEYVCVLTREGLECFDPADRNRRFWTRRYVPERTHVFGDDRHVVLVEMSAARQPTGVRVLRAGDGATVPGAPDSAAVLAAAKTYKVFGSTALLHEVDEDTGKQALRLLDLTTGKDVWRRDYDDKAVAVKAHDVPLCGMVRGTGEVDLLDPHTGRPVGAFKLDADRLADHIGKCRGAQLFADATRFYLVLDRDRNAGGGAAINRFGYGGVLQLRAVPVDGPMYCFVRATGERAWYADHHFENQTLILDRFGDLPVLVAGQTTLRPNGGQFEFKAVVVEKERGLLRFAQTLPDNSQMPFQTVTIDPRNRTVEYFRPRNGQALRLVVLPDVAK